jgi:hypothetical protein
MNQFQQVPLDVRLHSTNRILFIAGREQAESSNKKTLAFILCRRHIMSSNSFNTEKICILPTEYIYLDHMVLKINSDTSINSNN